MAIFDHHMNIHRIHRVAKLTGLSRDVIRVWERRYGLVRPSRSANRYRVYTDEDVALLRFLKEELEKGHTIGELAAEGRELLLMRMRATPVAQAPVQPLDRLINDLIAVLDPLDRGEFERRLNGAVAVIPFEEALQRVLLPLQEKIGELWHEGRINVAIEHYVTKLVQQKLFSVMNQLPVNDNGPRVVVGCPAGESHELGAQVVAYQCAMRGCQVYYLGPNVPLADLRTFCERQNPDLVLLSITEYRTDEGTRELLHSLEPISSRWPVAIGGHGARAVSHLIGSRRIEVLDDITALNARLQILLATRLPARA